MKKRIDTGQAICSFRPIILSLKRNKWRWQNPGCKFREKLLGRCKNRPRRLCLGEQLPEAHWGLAGSVGCHFQAPIRSAGLWITNVSPLLCWPEKPLSLYPAFSSCGFMPPSKMGKVSLSGPPSPELLCGSLGNVVVTRIKIIVCCYRKCYGWKAWWAIVHGGHKSRTWLSG